MNREEEVEKLVAKSIIIAAEQWSIERRLRFVRDMIFSQHGSLDNLSPERPAAPRESSMYLTVDILDGVIKNLEAYPKAEMFQTPKP